VRIFRSYPILGKMSTKIQQYGQRQLCLKPESPFTRHSRQSGSRAGLQTEHVHNAGYVLLERPFRDPELGGDLLGGSARGGKKADDFLFLRVEMIPHLTARLNVPACRHTCRSPCHPPRSFAAACH
jgi:hypothetical protein